MSLFMAGVRDQCVGGREQIPAKTWLQMDAGPMFELPPHMSCLSGYESYCFRHHLQSLKKGIKGPKVVAGLNFGRKSKKPRSC